MTIIDTSFNGDQKNNGNNSADRKQTQPFVNPFAKHIEQQAKNSLQIPNQKSQTPNLNRPNPHQIDSSTEISNPFAEHINKLSKGSFAQVVQKPKLPPARSISTPSPSTLDSPLSPSSKLEHSISAPVLEVKASSVEDSDDIPGSDSSSTDNNGADTNSSIPKIPLYFGKHKSKLMVPISTDLKVTGNGKPPSSTSSSSDAVMELQRIVKRAMVAGRLRRKCDNCGSTHHCCGRTILEAVSSIPPAS